jgi:Icc-related predicted phosphoesterase
MKICCISDTHNKHNDIHVPECDLLIHAGDFTLKGSAGEIQAFNIWLGQQTQAKQKVIIAGNHDLLFEDHNRLATEMITNAIYLQDSGATVNGYKFWGTPWTPRFHDWAFNQDRGLSIRRFYDLIPEDTDILITHGPAYMIGDTTRIGDRAGCEDLYEYIEKIKPKLHIFGHIHEGYGLYPIQDTIHVNASSLNVAYQPTNKPLVFNI